MLIHAKWYATASPTAVTIENGRIAAIGPVTAKMPDVQADWLAPAFFDAQVNGCLGVSFNSPALTIEDVRRVVDSVKSHGTNSFCPTLITTDSESFEHGFRTLRKACESDPALDRAMPCFHLEGPYICGDDGPRGAHSRRHVRPPDWDEFRRWQEAAGGRIRLVTLAPELEGGLEFIERLVDSGVVVSIGHTAATPEQIRLAVAAGARLSTHLGNGAHAVMARHPNYIWEQLANDELCASVIADGHHLTDSVLKCILRGKTTARTLLVSDASSLAGQAPGRYTVSGEEYEVLAEGRVAVAGTRFLAGAAVFLDSCVAHLLARGLATLEDAIEMASINPRRLLNVPIPELAVGQPADLIAFDWRAGAEFTMAWNGRREVRT